jgi:transcription elongation factor Elf1
MVHYNPPGRFAAQRPSPLCPKCGSHRTEIIGMSKDQKTKFLRCTVCGSHSEVSADETLAPVPAR